MAELIWTRRYSFQSVHTLLPAQERRHGHEYFLEVSFRGGAVDEVDDTVSSYILSRLHARELVDFPNPSGESIVDGIHAWLKATSIGERVCMVALQETRKNRFVSRWSEARLV